MKTLFLHVGFHKTGTSSIQAFLHNQKRQLLKLNILYPNTGLAGYGHGDLANSLKINYDCVKKQLLFGKLDRELNAFNGDKIVISSECFMESIDPQIIYDHFKRENLELRLIMYVRPQPAWAESLFNEIVKDSSRRYSGSILKMREIRRGDLNYHSLISRWADAFGNASITVRPFEKAQMVNGLYYDFLNVIDPELHSKIKLPAKDEIKNVSWDPRCVEFLRRINLIPMRREMHKEIVRVLDTASGELSDKFGHDKNGHLDRHTVERIIMMSGDSNDRVAKRWSSGSRSNPLFTSESWVQKYAKAPISLSADVENWLFERLPETIQSHLKRHSPKISVRVPGEKFLPTPPIDEETRLRCEILRLRMELNWMYST